MRLKGSWTRSKIFSMKKDIDKLADYIVEVTREGMAIERKILEWRSTEQPKPVAMGAVKAS